MRDEAKGTKGPVVDDNGASASSGPDATNGSDGSGIANRLGSSSASGGPGAVPSANANDDEPFSTWMLIRLAEAARGFANYGRRFIWVPRDAKGKVIVETPSEGRQRQGIPGYKGIEVDTENAPDNANKLTVKKVIVILSDGNDVQFKGDEADALFWTLPACEKFLFPYYAAQYGVDWAYEMRKKYVAADRALTCHHPGSEPCDPTYTKAISVAELLEAARVALL